MFFAYPSKPDSKAEAITEAIRKLREQTPVSATDWADLPTEGNLVFCEICSAIDASRCVVADITGFNFNVLFEFGFALGRGKPVWPLLESTSQSDRLYSEFETLTTVGYAKFQNSGDIVRKIAKKHPWQRRSSFRVPSPFPPDGDTQARKILYVKSFNDTEPSLRITEAFHGLPVVVTIDDPEEIPFRPLAWYLEELRTTLGVVIHLGRDDGESANLHMAKCALVGGIAVATGRKLLMLGERIQHKPVDYHDLLRTYNTAAQAAAIAKAFLGPIVSEIRALGERAKHDITSSHGRALSLLSRIELGDFVAENEVGSLESYFLETPQFREVVKLGFGLVVGRKGSGKSALAQMAGTVLERDARNIVCTIRPKAFELNQLVEYLKNLGPMHQGYFLDALWKYLIASETLKAIGTRMALKPYASLSIAEAAIAEYVTSNAEVLDLSFASRLIKVVETQTELKSPTSSIPESEVVRQLNVSTLRQMRGFITTYMRGYGGRVMVLVDGLDGNWSTAADRNLLADILLALISASADSWREWNRPIAGKMPEGSISIKLFLRSDIFRTLLERSKEPDKLQHEQLYWDDADSLLGVIERRIACSVLDDSRTVVNWEDLLDPTFSPSDMKALIERNILFRPRDIIFLFKRVLFHASRRDSERLTRRDFEQAMAEYSLYAVQSLSAEWQPFIPDMTNLLVEFMSGPSTYNYDQLVKVLSGAGIPEGDIRKVLKFLLEVNFLGLATDEGRFKFALTPAQASIMDAQASRFTEATNTRRFQIHKAFHDGLSLKDRGLRVPRKGQQSSWSSQPRLPLEGV